MSSKAINLRALSSGTLALSSKHELTLEQGRVVAKTASLFDRTFGGAPKQSPIALSAAVQSSLIRELQRTTPTSAEFPVIRANLDTLKQYVTEKCVSREEANEVELNFDAINVALTSKEPTLVGQAANFVSRAARVFTGTTNSAQSLERTLKAKRAQIRANLALISRADNPDIYDRLIQADRALAGQLDTVTRNPALVNRQAELRRDISRVLDGLVGTGLIANDGEKQAFLRLPVAEKLRIINHDLDRGHLNQDQQGDIALLVDLLEQIDPALERDQLEARNRILAGLGDVLTPDQIRELGGTAEGGKKNRLGGVLKRLVLYYGTDFIGGAPAVVNTVAGGVFKTLPFGLGYLPAMIKAALIIAPEEVIEYTPEAIKKPLREYVPQRIQNLFFAIVL